MKTRRGEDRGKGCACHVTIEFWGGDASVMYEQKRQHKEADAIIMNLPPL